MKDRTELFESPYVYIGDDEQYHVKEDAPDSVKEEFAEFFGALRTEENGVVTLA